MGFPDGNPQLPSRQDPLAEQERLIVASATGGKARYGQMAMENLVISLGKYGNIQCSAP